MLVVLDSFPVSSNDTSLPLVMYTRTKTPVIVTAVSAIKKLDDLL